jgi:hypothetical protein
VLRVMVAPTTVDASCIAYLVSGSKGNFSGCGSWFWPAGSCVLKRPLTDQLTCDHSPMTAFAGRRSSDCYQGVQHRAPCRPKTSLPNDKTLKNKAFFYLYKLVHSYGFCNQLLLAAIL